MDSLQATHDLGATPWADMRGDEWPVGLITRVGLAPGKLNPAERSVAIVISLPDGKRVVGLLDLSVALQALDYLKGSPLVRKGTIDVCTCGHMQLVHILNPKKIRTVCTHGDGSGPCRCRKFVAAD